MSSSSSSTIEIESQDVIRVMLQFLKENNLIDSMKTLQKESGVTLNTVDSIDHFASDVRNGRWDSVLAQVSMLRLPSDKLTNLYEQVVLELLEVGERELAKEIVRTVDPLLTLKNDHPERYLKLEHFCKRPFFNASEAYEMGSSKESKRVEIAESLSCEVSVVAPSRMLTLLGQSMKYQQSQGMLPAGVPFDLFKGVRKTAKKDIEEKIPRKTAGSIELSESGQVESILFSPDGQSLITGSIDGYIEAWDFETQALRQDLEYQVKEQFMSQEGSSILCCVFSRDSDHIATGSQNGQIKVWQLSTGVCLRKFPQAHPQGVTSVTFARDGTQILSTSYDQTARIHGLKSGKTLKEFRGHTSYVNTALYSKSVANNILTASSDGTIKLWDVRSTECLLTFRPSTGAGPSSGLGGGLAIKDTTVHTLQLMPNNAEQIFVAMKSPQAYIMTLHGQMVRSFSSGKLTGGDFTCATVSPQGKWLYCMGEDGIMYIFEVKTGQLENVLQVSGATNGSLEVSISNTPKDVVNIVHHPHRNLIATVSDKGVVKLWKP